MWQVILIEIATVVGEAAASKLGAGIGDQIVEKLFGNGRSPQQITEDAFRGIEKVFRQTLREERINELKGRVQGCASLLQSYVLAGRTSEDVLANCLSEITIAQAELAGAEFRELGIANYVNATSIRLATLVELSTRPETSGYWNSAVIASREAQNYISSIIPIIEQKRESRAKAVTKINCFSRRTGPGGGGHDRASDDPDVRTNCSFEDKVTGGIFSETSTERGVTDKLTNLLESKRQQHIEVVKQPFNEIIQTITAAKEQFSRFG